MTKLEFLQKLKLYIKKIDQFNNNIKSKFPNCESNAEKRAFIVYSQDMKVLYMQRYEQFSKMSDAEFNSSYIFNSINKDIDFSFKSIELTYKTLMKKEMDYTPSDPNNSPIL